MTASYDLEVWNIDRKSEEIRRTVKRDIQWASQRCVLSYHTSGIWNNQEEDVMFLAADRSDSQELFCTATNDGELRLFNYPCDVVAVSISL